MVGDVQSKKIRGKRLAFKLISLHRIVDPVKSRCLVAEVRQVQA
jgi:hypothetical protein